MANNATLVYDHENRYFLSCVPLHDDKMAQLETHAAPPPLQISFTVVLWYAARICSCDFKHQCVGVGVSSLMSIINKQNMKVCQLYYCVLFSTTEQFMEFDIDNSGDIGKINTSWLVMKVLL